jgi:hypothetical protein
VRDLGRISGTTAEESSKLIQVSDDLKIGYDTLTQAAKTLAKDGIALTTEELARSADEYMRITDAGERAQYATEKFGKAGLEMTKILEQGGAAIRQMAAEQSGNLILTEQQVTKAREFEQAQDSLNDTLEGFKVAIGSAILPGITAFLKGLDDLINREQKLTNVSKTQSDEIAKQTDNYEEFVRAMIGLRLEAQGSYNSVENINEQIRLNGGNVEKAAVAWGQWTRAQYDASRASETATVAIKGTSKGLSESEAAWKKYGNGVDIAKRALTEFETKAGELDFVTSGTFTKFEEGFASSMSDLQTQYAGFHNKIVEIETAIARVKYSTPDQIAQLGDAYKGLSAVEQKMKDLQDQADKESKMLFFKLLQSSGKLSEDQLMEVATSMGIVGQREKELYDKIKGHDFTNTSLNNIHGMVMEIYGTPASKEFEFDYYHRNHYSWDGDPGPIPPKSGNEGAPGSPPSTSPSTPPSENGGSSTAEDVGPRGSSGGFSTAKLELYAAQILIELQNMPRSLRDAILLAVGK